MLPNEAQNKMLRWALFSLILAIVLSCGAATDAAHRLALIGIYPGKPFLGPYYTIFSYLEWQSRAATSSIATDPRLPAIWNALYANLGFDLLLAATLGVPILLRRGKMPKKYLGLKPHTDWAALKDYKAANLIMHGKPGVVVGAVQPPPAFGIIRQKPQLAVYPGPRHVSLSAASRSGKDVGTNGFTHATWPYSNITNDPKGENYVLCSGLARDYYGKNVYRLSPGSPEVGDVFKDSDGNERVEQFGSSAHNIYDEVDWGTDNEYWQTLQISTMLVTKTPKDLDGENGHWYRGSRVINQAVMYKVMYDPLETWKAQSRVADILSGRKDVDSEQHDALRKSSGDQPADTDSIHEIIEEYLGFSATGWGSKPKWLLRAIDDMRTRAEFEIAQKRKEIGIGISEADYARWEIERRKRLTADVARLEHDMRHPDMERALRNTMRIRGDEAGSMYSTLNARLSVWLDPNVIRNTRTSSYSILSLKNGPNPSGLWIVNPLDRADMYYDIIRVEYDLMLRKLYPEMSVDFATKRVKSPHRWPCLWMLNEPGSIGEIPFLLTALPVAASYEDMFVFMWQTPAQMEEIYGENGAKIITENCGVRILHTPQDDKVAEAVSEGLGVRMVLSENESFNGMQRTRAIQADNVPLMSPAQLKAMPTEPLFQTEKVKKVMPNGEIRYEEKMKVDAEGSPVRRIAPAYQVVYAPNMPPGYMQKVQWFYKREFPGVYRIIKSFRPALPDRGMIARTHVEIQAAEIAATRDDVQRQPFVPETPTRSKARLSDMVQIEMLDPQALVNAGVFKGARSPVTSSATGAAASAAVATPTRRKRRVVALSDKFVQRERPKASGDIPPSFKQFE
jgi:type IV secretory pathway TraG/TraD family ATPase VirD4